MVSRFKVYIVGIATLEVQFSYSSKLHTCQHDASVNACAEDLWFLQFLMGFDW